MAPPGVPHGCSRPAPAPDHLPLSGLQTRPDSRLLPGHQPRTLGQGAVLFCKKVTNRGLLPGVSSHRKCLVVQRKEREHPPQEAAVCPAGPGLRQHHLSRTATLKDRYSQLCATRGKSGVAGSSDQSRPGPLPRTLEGRAEAGACQASSCPACHPPTT